MIQEHPSLIQAASYIAAAIAKEGGGGRHSTRNLSRVVGDEYDSDDELRGIEPGVRRHVDHVLSKNKIYQQKLSQTSSYPSLSSAQDHYTVYVVF